MSVEMYKPSNLKYLNVLPLNVISNKLLTFGRDSPVCLCTYI